MSTREGDLRHTRTAAVVLLVLALVLAGEQVFACFSPGCPEFVPDDDPDDDDGDDDDSGSGSSSPPDVPSAAEIVHLAGRYTDAQRQYAQALGRYETLSAGTEAGLAADAATAAGRVRTAEERARTHLRRVEETAAARARETAAVREASLERAFAATGVTAGDPVSLSTGTFITSETDVAWRHGGLDVAVRRTYRSGAWPSGGFGVWSWPFDSRIIRGLTPGAAEAADEARAARAVVQEELRGARDAVSAVFGAAAVGDADGVESRFAREVDEWSRLAGRAAGASEAADAVAGLADALSVAHTDWQSPPRYAELAAEARSLHTSVRRGLSRAEGTLADLRAVRALLAALSELEAAAAAAAEAAARVAERSRAAADLNRYALRPADPAYLEETGAGTLTLVDARGVPHVYRLTGEGGRTEPAGATTSTDTLSVTADGGYLRRLADGTRYHYSRWGLLERIEDRNANTVELARDAERQVSAISDDVGRRLLVRRRAGRVVSVTDPAGGAIRYAYDDLGRLIRVTDAVGDSITYDYTGTRLTRIGKPDGSARHYHYDRIDDAWRVTSTVDEEGHAEYFRYDPGQGITVYENPSGIVTRYHLDERGQAVRIIRGDGSEVRNDYDAPGNLIAHTDGRGRVWRREYDGAGRLTAAVDPEGHRREWAYDEFGGVRRYRDPLGRVTTVSRDDRGNPIRIRYPDGSAEHLGFTARGRLQAVVDRSGATTRYFYGPLGYPAGVAYPDGAQEHFEHDVMGRLTRYTDETGVTDLFEYRPDGLLAAKVRIPAGGGGAEHRIVYDYDARKDRVARTGPRGYRTGYRYDRRHNLTAVEPPAGDVTSYRYRGDGRLVERRIGDISTTRLEYDARGLPAARIQVETGARTTFTYDATGNLVRRRDPAGGVTRWRFSPAGRLLSREGPAGGRVSYDYDAAGALASVTDERGFRWHLGHDELGRRREVRGPAGFRRRTTYADGRRRITVTDALDRHTVLAYDERWRLIERTDPAGATERWSYDAAGRVLSHTDRTGAVRRLSYDGFGRVAAVTGPAGGTERYDYDAAGNRTRITDPLGNTTSFSYDAAGRRIAVTDPAGGRTQFRLDAMGNRRETHHPDGTVVRRRFDGAGNLVSIVDERGNETRWGYDAASRPVSMTDPLGARRSWSRDAAGRVTSTTRPSGATTQYEYDPAGNLIAMTDARGRTYRWEYTPLGRLGAEVDRSGNRRELSYDAAGGLVKRLGFDGRRTRFRRDELGRLSEVRYPGDEQAAYTYDAEGRLLRAVNDTADLVFAYDRAGRMTSSADRASGTRLEYRYDAAGNRVAVRLEPEGTDIVSTYDERGLLTSIIEDGRRETRLGYDERGREISRRYPNGVERRTSYTATGRVSGLVYRAPGHGVVAGEAYVYDETGRRKLRADEDGRVTVYDYDADGRLREVRLPTVDEGSQTFTSLTASQMSSLLGALETAMPERKALLSAVQPSRAQGFRYDEAGDRSRMNTGAGATRYGYDAAGRLRAAGATRYAHDAAGNLVSIEHPDRSVELAYGPRNRVVRAEVSARGGPAEDSTAVVRFGYDALGRRVLRHDGSAALRYVYDRRSITPIAALRIAPGAAGRLIGPKPGLRGRGRYHYLGRARADATGVADLERVFIWVGDELLAKRDEVHDDMGYGGVDERGSLIVTFDEHGDVRDRLSYDAFGGSADPGAVYAGKLLDPLTGMYDFGYRDYDPATGRFTTVDPVKDGTNWYSFVDGDPINRRDPNGLFISVGPGLGYNERTDRYQTTDGRSIRDKSRIHIARNSESDEFYNDSMQLKVDDLVLTDAAVQSEADTPGSEHQTVPTGRYEGHLLDFSGSYDDPILLENESKGVPAGDGYLIHPNEFTNPTRVEEAKNQGQHTGPWNQPYSEGCQISRGTDSIVALREEVSRLGFRNTPGSHFQQNGGVVRDPDSIEVRIKNR